MGAPSRLVIAEDLYRAMIDHVRAACPEEGCGLIAVAGDRAVKLFPGTNIEHSPTRYNMDPVEVLAAFNEMDRHQWQLGAIFHSHPETAPIPSETDLRHAYYADALMVIISLAVDPPEVRAWRVDGEVREVPLMIVPQGDGTGARDGEAGHRDPGRDGPAGDGGPVPQDH